MTLNEYADELEDALRDIYNASFFDWGTMPEKSRKAFRKVVEDTAEKALALSMHRFRLKSDFPYKYVGGGYFRHKSLPSINEDKGKAYRKALKELTDRGIPAILHGEQVVEYTLK